MSEFWSYEDKRTYNRRQADFFEVEARKYLWGEMNGDPTESGISNPIDLDSIQPKSSSNKGGSIFGKALNLVDDITSTAFLGEVRQPWDVMRPIQRLFEAEAKYIAKPLARKTLSTVGVNYDELPGVAKFAIEAGLSPSSWVGVGLIGKVGKVAKIAQLEKWAATEDLGEYLVKSGVPNILASAASGLAEDVGLPGWAGAPVGLLSFKGLDMWYGQEGLVKQVPDGARVSIVMPETTAYHGASYPGNPEVSFVHKVRNDDTSGFTGIFFSTNPRSGDVLEVGAGAWNTPVTTYDLQNMSPEQTFASSRGLSVTRNPDVDPEKLAQQRRLKDLGIPVPLGYRGKYSVYVPANTEKTSLPGRVEYFDSEDEVVKFLNTQVEYTGNWWNPSASNTGPRWGEPESRSGARIYPMVIKPGSKLWDPNVDPHPQALKDALAGNAEARNHWQAINEPRLTLAPAHFDVMSPTERASIQKELTDQGYSGIHTLHETIIWDESVIAPLYQYRSQKLGAQEIMRNLAVKEPTWGMALPAVAKAFPAPGSARGIGLAMMADGEDDLLKKLEESVELYKKGPEAWDAAMEEQGRRITQMYDQAAHEQKVIRSRAGKLSKAMDRLKQDPNLKSIMGEDPEEYRRAGGSLGSVYSANMAGTIRGWDYLEPEEIDARMARSRLIDPVNKKIAEVTQARLEGIKRYSLEDVKDEIKTLESIRNRAQATLDGTTTQFRDEEARKSWAEWNRSDIFRAERVLEKLYERYLELTSQPAWKRGPGTMRAQPEELANRLNRLYDANVPDIFGWQTVEDALTHAMQNRSFTQWFRTRIADMIPREWETWLNEQGIVLRDDEVSYLIRARAEKIQQGDQYGAVMADLIRGRLRKQAVLTQEIRGAGTVIKDPKIVAAARAVEQLRPGTKLVDRAGQVHLEDLIEYQNLFDLTDDQRAWLQTITAIGDNAKVLEKVMKVGIEDPLTPDGVPVHRQPLSRPVIVEDPRSLEKYPVQIKEGPVLRSRVGATQTAGKARTVGTKAEGYDAGIEYLPFADAQHARFTQGWRTMADTWLKDATSDISRKPSQLLDPVLVETYKDAVHLRRQYNWLDSQLKLALRNPGKYAFKSPQFTVRPELQDLFDQAAWTGQNSKKELRIAGWKAVRDRLEGIKEPWESSYHELRESKRVQLKQIQSYGTEEFPVDFQGRRYPLEAGRQLTKLNKPEGNGIAERTLGWFNKNTRPLMATMDASFASIQGLIGLANDPVSYFRAWRDGVLGDYDAYIERRFADGLLDAARDAGLYYAARNDFGEFLFPRSVLNLPGIGKLADKSNTWFTNFGNVLRLEMFDAGYRAGMSPTDLSKLARTVNLATGFNPGKPTSVETIALFAPRFFRAQLAMISDGLTRTVTPSKGLNAQGDVVTNWNIDLGRKSTARLLGQTLTAGAVLTMGVNELLGQSTDLDWDSPNFMRIRFAERDFSLFGPWDSLMRAVSYLYNDGPDEAAIYLARSKASPAASQLLNIIYGETYTGEELNFGTPEQISKSAATIARGSLVPIGISSATKEGLPQDLNDILGIGTSFLGIKASEMTEYEHLVTTQEDLARTTYNRSWDDLEPFEKRELESRFDLELEPNSDTQKAIELRGNIEKRFTARQKLLDENLPIGREWIEARNELRREQVGAYAQWAEEHPEAAAKIRAGGSSKKNPNETARQTYYSILDQAGREDWTPAETSDALEAFEASLSPEQQAYLERNLGLKDTPRVREFKAAQDILRPYWRLADKVWDSYKTRSPEASQFESLQEYQNSLVLKWQDEGLSDSRILQRMQTNTLMRQVQRATDVVRERLRRSNSDIDKELVKWYGYTPIRSRDR